MDDQCDDLLDHMTAAALLRWCRLKRLSLRDEIRNRQEADWIGVDPFDLGEEPGRAALHDAANSLADLGNFTLAHELNEAAKTVWDIDALPFLLQVEEWCLRSTAINEVTMQSDHNSHPAIDLAIVIPLQEEFEELHKEIEASCLPQRNVETGAYDYVFRRPGTNGEYHCVATFVGDMGETKAGLRTQQILSKWNPKTLVVMGIAAGISEDLMIGDVVIGTEVESYLQNAKAIDNSQDGYIYKYSGEAYRSNNGLINECRHFQFAHQLTFRAWRESAQKRMSVPTEKGLTSLVDDNLLRSQPLIFFGKIASGPIVAAANSFVAELRDNDRKFLALEMESGGALAANHDAWDSSHALVIRGISDFGDERKKSLDHVGSGALRRYAVQNAIHFLWALLDCDALPKAMPANPL